MGKAWLVEKRAGGVRAEGNKAAWWARGESEARRQRPGRQRRWTWRESEWGRQREVTVFLSGEGRETQGKQRQEREIKLEMSQRAAEEEEEGKGGRRMLGGHGAEKRGWPGPVLSKPSQSCPPLI